jgi:hypothetical protein
VPNLMTDRGLWVTGFWRGWNVRRLMYQPLIWALVLGDDARCLGPPLDAKDLKRLPDALVDGVRRNVQLGRNLLGREMPIDKSQAIQLAGGQAGYTLGHGIVIRGTPVFVGGVRQTRRLLKSKTPARHLRHSEQ